MKRLRVSILAGLIPLLSLADLCFSEPQQFYDIGLSMPLPVGAYALQAGIVMPKASVFRAESNGKVRVRERFDEFDLWLAREIRGRWEDSSGNRFEIVKLDAQAPSEQRSLTRKEYERGLKMLDLKDAAAREESVMALAPDEVGEPSRAHRSRRRNLRQVIYYPPVNNERLIVAAFLPNDASCWYLAALSVAEGEDMEEARKKFDNDYIDRVSLLPVRSRSAGGKTVADWDEKELLLRDLHRSVTNYQDWAVSESDNVVVLDNLSAGDRERFIESLAADMVKLRDCFAKSAPPPTEETNRLAVVRIFKERSDYLQYISESGNGWSAAVWSPLRLELVAHLPASGLEELVATIRHEAFHQYLEYACAFSNVLPWFNEGHAKLFEDSRFDKEGRLNFEVDERALKEVRAYIQANDGKVDLMPLMKMDYNDFYAGTHEDRILRYNLAWSIAYFFEKGAPKVRFNPFANLRADYLREVLDTKDPVVSVDKMFPPEVMKLFNAEWTKFWKSFSSDQED